MSSPNGGPLFRVHTPQKILYRLAVLRLQVRMAVVGPLVIDFAVHEEERVVFIRGVKAMSGHGLE